ncbi:CD80-like C2-set immunoglobulin domain [Popillia japonica]|uniref:CD80-like C2-set immunoglobulin domain n=1 Tax=Popillia japonica TaxID=7064 RepID=A0AAW1LD39_POPJA
MTYPSLKQRGYHHQQDVWKHLLLRMKDEVISECSRFFWYNPPRKPYLLIDNRILDPGNLFIPVKENTDLTVSCVVDGGNPRPTLSWELTLGSLALLDAPEVPFQALNLSETVREQKVGARNDARLERVMRAHHNATLTCIVHHIALLQPLNVSLLLDVQCLHISKPFSNAITLESQWLYPITHRPTGTVYLFSNAITLESQWLYPITHRPTGSDIRWGTSLKYDQA